MSKGKYIRTPEMLKKQSESMKRKYCEGEITIWNKGLTKEMDERIAKSGFQEGHLCFVKNFSHPRHGHAKQKQKTSTYSTWLNMIQRCTNPHDQRRWSYYGGRGITVCDRWLQFENFLADMGERPEGKTIDRIDPNGNYEPGNCRWATWKEQRANHASR